jgi:hypothetical protein
VDDRHHPARACPTSMKHQGSFCQWSGGLHQADWCRPGRVLRPNRPGGREAVPPREAPAHTAADHPSSDEVSHRRRVHVHRTLTRKSAPSESTQSPSLIGTTGSVCVERYRAPPGRSTWASGRASCQYPDGSGTRLVGQLREFSGCLSHCGQVWFGVEVRSEGSKAEVGEFSLAPGVDLIEPVGD